MALTQIHASLIHTLFGTVGCSLVGEGSFASTFGQIPLPVAGTFQNWRIRSLALAASGGTRTLKLQKNGSDAASSITLTDAVQEGLSAISVACAAGDYVNFNSATTGSPGQQHIQSSMEWVPDDGVSHIYGFMTATPHQSNPCFIGVLGDAGQATTDAAQSSLWGTDGEITALAVRVRASAPGSGKSYTCALVVDGVVQDGSGGTVDTRATIADANFAASASFSLPVTAGQTVSVKCTPSGGPNLTNLGGAIAFAPDAAAGVMYASTPDLTNGSGTFYMLPAAAPQADDSTTEANDEYVGPETSLTITGLRVKIPAPTSGHSRSFTLRKNQTDTDITVTLADSETDGAVSGEVEITSSDRWSIKEIRSGSPAGGVGRWVLTSGAPVSKGNLLVGAHNTLITPSSHCVIAGENGTLENSDNVVLLSLDGNENTVSDTDGALIVFGDVLFKTLPTSDPGVSGQLWNDAGTLKVST